MRALFALGVGCGSSLEPGLSPSPAGQLVFTSDRTGAMAVYAQTGPRETARRLSPSDGGHWFAGPVRPGGGQMAWLRSQDSPVGEHLEQLFIWDEEGELVAGPAARAVRNPAWSPDGRLLAVESSSEGFRDIWTWAVGQEPRQQSAVKDGCFEPRFTLDGRQLLAVCSGGDLDLRRLRVESPTPDADPARLFRRLGEDSRPTPHPSEPVLAFVGALDGRLGVWTSALDGTGAGPAWIPPAESPLLPEQGLHWSEDGRGLAVVTRRPGGGGRVHLLRWEGTRPHGPAAVQSLPGTVASLGQESPSWLPDGTLLVTVDRSGDVDLWRVDPATGAHEVWVEGPGTDWLPRWWPAR